MAEKRSRWKAWIPVGLWLVVLTLESSNLGSSEHSGVILRKIWTALFGAPSEQTFEFVHHAIRKTGHFCGYAILGVLIFRAVRMVWRSGQAVTIRSREWVWQWRWAVYALLGTALAARLTRFIKRSTRRAPAAGRMW